MTVFVALLRAVNVGGTGKLPMTELKRLCEAAGLQRVETYIASGNVVFQSEFTEIEVKAALEAQLSTYAGKPVAVLVRTADEMAAALAANPLADKPPNATVAIFLDAPPPSDLLDGVKGQNGEEIRPGKREIYVHYGDGMGRSKLKIAAAANGTARNINTVAKLADMARRR